MWETNTTVTKRPLTSAASIAFSQEKELREVDESTGKVQAFWSSNMLTGEDAMKRIIGPSILDLAWGRTQKEIMEIGQEKVEVEALDLKSLIEPWVKMQNWVSKVEETESQARTMDKVIVVTTNWSNQLGMARGTEKLERVKGEDRSLVGKED